MLRCREQAQLHFPKRETEAAEVGKRSSAPPPSLHPDNEPPSVEFLLSGLVVRGHSSSKKRSTDVGR